VLRLRRLIGDPDVVVTRAPGYLLRLAPGDLDSQRFEELVAEGRRELDVGDPERAAAVLREALGLWRGDALADVPPSSAIEVEAERLVELRLAATELRIEADLSCGRCAQVVPELRAMLIGGQLRERLWLLLMRALDGAGRRAEALEAYAQAREAIADQLGVDPGVELRRLHQELLAADRDQTASRQRPAANRRAPAGPPARSDAPRRRAPTAASPGVSAETSTATRPQPPRRTEPEVEAALVRQAIDDERRADDAQRPEAAGRDEPSLPVGSVAGGSVPASAAPARYVWPPVPRPAQLPADIGDFTGRGDIVAHLCWLLSSRDAMDNPGAVPVAVVAGSGGLGKTSLAVHAAHQLTRAYPDGQLYVDLLGATPHPQAPSDVLARFLRDLGVEGAQVPAGEEERAALYRTRLAGRRVLVLLDNARDAAQVRSLLPGSSTCGVLVTARSRMPDLAPSKLVDLEVLDDDESLTLFTRIVGEKRAAAEPEATAEVMVACAGLPLAIRICAARLAARSRWSIQTLAERLKTRLLDELRTGDMAVRASFQVSFDTLPAAGNPARMFRLLGLWQGPFISLAAATALVGRPEAEVEEALEVLVDAYLLESPAPDQYRFHDLLRVYAAERAHADETEDERQTALRRLLAWYLHSTDAAAQAIRPLRTRIELSVPAPGSRSLEFANADAAFDWCEEERANLVVATREAAANGMDEVAWQLPASASPFFNRRGYRGDWIASHEIALTSVRKAPDPGGEAQILNNLGMAYRDVEVSAAIGYFEQALAIRHKIGDLIGEAQTVINLDDAHLRSGQYAKVVAAHEETLTAQQRVRDRDGEGIALGNVGEAYLGLGRLEDAAECLRQAEKIFRETDDGYGLGWVLQSLGATQLGLGQSEEGLASLRQAVTVHHAVRERRGEAAALLRLGAACRREGLLSEARSCLDRAHEIFTELGDDVQLSQVRAEMTAPGAS
jgi:DNA-binding SARP family transcriptional activator